MNVETILRNKGSRVATIRPGSTIAEAVETLNRERIGAIVVSEDGESVDGILSETSSLRSPTVAPSCCRAASTRS